jgi:hypothetical protein
MNNWRTAARSFMNMYICGVQQNLLDISFVVKIEQKQETQQAFLRASGA